MCCGFQYQKWHAGHISIEGINYRVQKVVQKSMSHVVEN